MGSVGLGLFCFPSNTDVYTRLGLKKITDVQIGDDIKVMMHDNTIGFSPVIGWLHNDANQDGEFIELWTATRRAITLSPDHLLPIVRRGENSSHSLRHHEIQGAQYVTASSVVVGDFVLMLKKSADGTERLQCEPVTALRTVQSKGIYAPLTMSGTVVVDSAAASCYASVPSHSTAHTAMAPIRAAYELRGPESMAKHHTEKDGKKFHGAHSYVDKLGRIRFHHQLHADASNSAVTA